MLHVLLSEKNEKNRPAKVNVKKILSVKWQWVCHKDLKGTFNFLLLDKAQKIQVYLHWMIGAVFHWVKKVPSYDQ